MEKINKDPNVEKLPNTRFEQANLDKETHHLSRFMKDDRWSKVFDKTFPGLRHVKENTIDAEGLLIKYHEFLKDIRKQDEERIVAAQEQIQLEWNKIGPSFLEELSLHFETDWDPEREIVGYISVLPVYPRFLKERTFFTDYKDIQNAIEVSAHEILHFLWFKKWKEVFPETRPEECESPHLVWRLSEIMDPIILQCNSKIKELIKPVSWGYGSFKEIKIGNVSMTEYFKNIYLNSITNGDAFDVTLRKLFEEAKAHEKEISRF